MVSVFRRFERGSENDWLGDPDGVEAVARCMNCHVTIIVRQRAIVDVPSCLEVGKTSASVAPKRSVWIGLT